jgi:hypothetical protein
MRGANHMELISDERENVGRCGRAVRLPLVADNVEQVAHLTVG